ncbi:hypothetical protein FQA39_LY10317 [Lamprigera yunnana]|nr:hypothetical protein FQA39_LY10317 [Lamprigera yunnana]
MSALLKLLCNKFNAIKISNNVALKYSYPLLNAVKNYSNAYTHYEVVDPHENKLISEEVIKKVNNAKNDRLFAIVHIAGKQFKVTEGDVLIVEGYWPPTCGDKINLEKVLMVGSPQFTLIGCPLVQTNLVNVWATVIEKTISHSKVNFKKKRRKQYKRINFYRIQQTMLRINKVEMVGELNQPPEVVVKERTI